MRNPIQLKVATSVATFLFSASIFAQTPKPFAPKIQTPSTKEELVTKEPAKAEAEVKTPAKETETENNSGPAPRRLQLHTFGVGLGETFLMGNYAKHGEDKITMDLFYAYAASYSFDVLVNAHWSTHEDKRERMRVAGLNAAIKSRLFEFDNFSPFVMGGLGFYAPRAKRYVGGDLKKSEQKITFGPNFGGGADLRLNDQWTIGALGQLHWPFSIEQDNQSDLKGYYFKLLLTIAYSI
jgi:hypothetical protein